MSRILILDESYECTRLACKLLERAGHEVYLTNESPAALEIISQLQPHLALVNIDMQHSLPWRALVEAMRVRGMYGMSIIAYLSLPADKAMSLAQYCGCDGVIDKPIDTRAFAGQINFYLGQAPIKRTVSLN